MQMNCSAVGTEDPLCTMQVAQLLGNALGMVLPSTIVFDYPSIASLAAAIAGPPEGPEDKPLPDGGHQSGSGTQTLQRRRSSFADLFKGRHKSLSDVFAHRCVGVFFRCMNSTLLLLVTYVF